MARPQASLREDVRMLGSLVKFRMASDWTKKVQSIYEMYPPGHLMTEESTYFNQGYWETGNETYDAAQEALAGLLADTVGMREGDTVLDCGFGYGDQDFYWLKSRRPRQIFGINITPKHVEFASDRARREGVTDRVNFQLASATEIPFPDNTFDRVVSLESAMHYQPRSQFFKEAYRVLKPGGVIATADIVPMPGAGPRENLKAHALGWLKWTVDDRNWHDRDVYAEKLSQTGFESVGVTTIQPKVWEPWRAYITKKVADPAFKPTVSKLYYRVLQKAWADPELLKRELETVDYIMAAGTKPLT
ncbi:Erythromycin 3''-O-methyltransferase [Streptomyces sp. S4.7]|nr:Erythromycin 3''-O-methyltransferase [Streptomyces sp. S4.7]